MKWSLLFLGFILLIIGCKQSIEPQISINVQEADIEEMCNKIEGGVKEACLFGDPTLEKCQLIKEKWDTHKCSERRK